MQLKYKILIIIIFVNFPVFGQNKLWTVGTAFTMPRKNVEISLFRPARVGIGKKTEFSMHPFGTFVMPHAFIKHIWGQPIIKKRKFTVSTQHGLYYPTFALKLFQKIPTLGLTPPAGNIPSNLAFRNEILISHYLFPPSHCYNGNYLLTLRIGIKNSFSPDTVLHPTVYEAVLHRESMVLYRKPVWYVGLDFDASLSSSINYFVDLEYRQVWFKNKSWALESKFGLMGYSGDRMSAFFGLKAAVAKMYQAGYDFKIFPLVDISYTFRITRDKSKEKGLFKKDRFHFYDFHKDDPIR